MAEEVVRAEGLTKRYNGSFAVQELDLHLRKGEVVGLLGPNGSGKTTTILMLLGLTEPTEGAVEVLGMDPLREPLAVKQRVSYMPDSVGFYEDMSARENLEYTARLAGMTAEHRAGRIETMLEQLQLAEVAEAKVKTYSRGMKQRLALAEVLMKEPAIIILDEPTAGLDPEAAAEFLELIRGLKSREIAVLLSSHLLHQVQEVCDRVLLFHEGRAVLEGSVAELSRRVLGGRYVIQLETIDTDPRSHLGNVEEIVQIEAIGEGSYRIEATDDIRGTIAGTLVNQGCDIRRIELYSPGLNDIYTRYFEEVRGAKA